MMKKFVSILLMLVLLLSTFCGCSKQQEIDRTKSAIYTDNFEITTGMLSYYFNVQYISFLNTYSDSLDQIGLDTEKPLSEQTCSFNSNTTWYDYFMDIAKTRLTQCLVIAEQAKIDGEKLSKADLKEIDELEKTITAEAKEENLSAEKYITKTFGENTSFKDIAECTKLEKLTMKYYENFVDTLDTGENAMEDYFAGHKKAYCTVDYLYFSFPADSPDQTKINETYQKAVELSESDSAKDFIDFAQEYLYEYYEEKHDGLSESEIEEMVSETVATMQVNDAPYSSSSSASRWAFSDERIENEGTVFENNEQDTYDVYYLLTPPRREEYKITTIRQIIINPADYESNKAAKKRADKILEELEGSKFSKETFINLAADYSADTATATNGGLYEKLSKGVLKDSEELESWIFQEGRLVGDSAVIETKAHGIHVVYIEEQGNPVWLEQVRQDFQNARFEDYVTELSDNFMVYENNNLIYKINETDQSDFEPAA